MYFFMAERRGFEPPMPFSMQSFQDCALDQLCDLSVNEFLKCFATLSFLLLRRKYTGSSRKRQRCGNVPFSVHKCIGKFAAREYHNDVKVLNT